LVFWRRRWDAYESGDEEEGEEGQQEGLDEEVGQ
jgi:hypothetical protein